MVSVLIASSNDEIKDYAKAVMDLNKFLFPIMCPSNYIDIQERISLLAPEFVLVDLLKDFNHGLKLVKQIKRDFKEIKIIGISISKDRNKVIDSFRCGIDGYLVNDSIFNEIYRCVCTILQGDKYVSNAIVNDVLRYYTHVQNKELEKSTIRISSKEREHIKYIAMGFNPKEIAHVMQISKKTVDNYRIKIMKKLDVFSIAAIVKYAIKEELVEL